MESKTPSVKRPIQLLEADKRFINPHTYMPLERPCLNKGPWGGTHLCHGSRWRWPVEVHDWGKQMPRRWLWKTLRLTKDWWWREKCVSNNQQMMSISSSASTFMTRKIISLPPGEVRWPECFRQNNFTYWPQNNKEDKAETATYHPTLQLNFKNRKTGIKRYSCVDSSIITSFFNHISEK